LKKQLGWLDFRAGASRVALGQTLRSAGKRIPPSSKVRARNPRQISLGFWIEVARQVRARADALNQGDYASAVSHADQAAKAAPQDAEIWFPAWLLRPPSEHYQVQWTLTSMASNATPTPCAGLAGLAQTYVKMGRDVEARQVLLQVVQANPKIQTALLSRRIIP